MAPSEKEGRSAGNHSSGTSSRTAPTRLITEAFLGQLPTNADAPMERE
jgi:hypothetical protein